MPRGVRAFGGFNLERSHQQHLRGRASTTRTCRSTAISARAASRGRSSSRARWSTRCRVWGISGERGVPEPERLPGRHARPRPTAASPPAPASTTRAAWPRSGRSRSTHGHAPTHRPHARRPAADWPRGLASIQVPLVAPETRVHAAHQPARPLVQQADPGRMFSIQPKIDFFNALNSDDYSSVATAQFGAADLPAALGDPAGPHHPHRRRRDLVATPSGACRELAQGTVPLGTAPSLSGGFRRREMREGGSRLAGPIASDPSRGYAPGRAALPNAIPPVY